MDDRRWDQIAAATGIAFVVLLVIGRLIAGQPPDVSAKPGEIRRYFVDHQSGLLLQGFLLGLAGVFFIWFAGTLRAFLRAAEGGAGRLSAISFGSAIGVLATFGPTVALSQTLTSSVARGSPPLAHALYELSFWFGDLVAFPVAVFIGAAALSAGRTRALPSWLAWGGLVVAGLSLLQGFDFFVRGTDFFQPNGFLGYVNYFLGLLWVLAASVLLLQRAGATGRARTTNR
ncbi:MAG TPA: hypothetical protein VF660_02460 [Actinomycetota bacterium]|jgi:hypothetical protein